MRARGGASVTTTTTTIAVAVALASAASLGATACRPVLDDRPWLVTGVEIVGWTAEPPEARPGATVTLHAVAAAGPGTTGLPDASATAWGLCRAPKPLGESRPLSPECLAPAAGASPDALGDPAMLAIPADACRLFGPDVPQPAAGAPPTRPRDPDATGGYYQPVTVTVAGAFAAGLVRVTCGLPDASFAVARAFLDAYTPNLNPTLAPLALTSAGVPVDPAAVPPGALVRVEAAWPDGTAESFPVFDRAAGALGGQRENLRVAWFVTGGALDVAAADITDGVTLSASTTWTAPAAPGVFEVVVVLRDSRGGSAAARASLAVAAQ